MIVLSQQVQHLCVINGHNDKADLLLVKQKYMWLFDISTDDTRCWTPAESRGWLEFIKTHTDDYGRLNSTILHTFVNLNENTAVTVIGGGELLSQLYWHCENGESSTVSDL